MTGSGYRLAGGGNMANNDAKCVWCEEELKVMILL
jgi:hypothetical protein